MSNKHLSELNKIKKKCFKCGSSKSYTNQFGKCFECGEKFCHNHIWGGQINEKMGENEAIRDACWKCKKRNNYRDL